MTITYHYYNSTIHTYYYSTYCYYYSKLLLLLTLINLRETIIVRINILDVLVVFIVLGMVIGYGYNLFDAQTIILLYYFMTL